MSALTAIEEQRVLHWWRYGTDSVPVVKVKSGWVCEPFPNLFKTKTEAVAMYERHINALQERQAEYVRGVG